LLLAVQKYTFLLLYQSNCYYFKSN
jgi:hypothetical protein